MTNSVFIKLESATIEIVDYDKHSLLNAFFELFSDAVCDSDTQVDLVLNAKSDGLHLTWNIEGSKPLKYYIDVEKVVKQLRSYPAPKQGAFNQALGKKTQHIIDATGGWGGDAILMCCQGYKVTVLEREPVMALLLSDAMTRLAKSSWAEINDVQAPRVIQTNARDYFTSQEGEKSLGDCVYLDPMFPPKKKKTAAVNKQMQLLQWLVGEDQDASQLVESALNAGASRIAVKRPDYAEPLHAKPSVKFSSKLVHYDVYLAS